MLEEQMADIEKLIKDLQSDNPGKRFQACNELFYAQSIPESAIEALRQTTQDSDPVIANAAQRALGVHTETTTNPELQLENKYKPTPMTDLNGVVLMVWAGIIAVFFFFLPIFLTALIVFGTLFSKWNTPGSEIGAGKFVLISTTFGVISGIVWQLILFLLLSLFGGIALIQ